MGKKRTYPYQGKYDALTCEGFGRGSSYKTIYGGGEKKLQDYIRTQNGTVSILPEEDMQDLPRKHPWFKEKKLPVPEVRSSPNENGVLPRKGKGEGGIFKH